MAQAPPVNFSASRIVGVMEDPEEIPFLSEQNITYVSAQVSARLRQLMNKNVVVDRDNILSFLNEVYAKRQGSFESMLTWTIDLLVNATIERFKGGSSGGFTVDPQRAHLTNRQFDYAIRTNSSRAKMSTM